MDVPRSAEIFEPIELTAGDRAFTMTLFYQIVRRCCGPDCPRVSEPDSAADVCTRLQSREEDIADTKS